MAEPSSSGPVIYVSMNYRLTGFGFMPGQEVKAAGVGNLGLQDREFLSSLQVFFSEVVIEREAFRWIQKYIGQFGGDSTKVTMCVSSSFLCCEA